jgi:hypothetical protein
VMALLGLRQMVAMGQMPTAADLPSRPLVPDEAAEAAGNL